MTFNVQKCKVMHIGHGNMRYEYEMGGKRLESSAAEKDLGVVVTDKLKPANQCSQAAATAQRVLGQICRAFHYRDKLVFIQLYKTYVRPHLEFSVQAWAPWSQADKDLIEKVQRRAVGMVSGLTAGSYEDKLAELGMVTLEERRHQADMALTYKILTGREAVDPATWFIPASENGRETRATAGMLNVQRRTGRLEVRRNFFSVRTCEAWNSTPDAVKKQKTVNGFKMAYAKYRQNAL